MMAITLIFSIGGLASSLRTVLAILLAIFPKEVINIFNFKITDIKITKPIKES